MKLKFLSLALLARYVSTQPPINRMPMLRFECSQLVIERLDPLVNPGMIPSPHVHQIVGRLSEEIIDLFGLALLLALRATFEGISSDHRNIGRLTSNSQTGGNSFNASMDPATHDLPSASTCTSCTFSEDFSNYWTAVLYFRARNGTYKRVPQYPSEGLTGDGGITVYYIASPDASVNVTAFRPGFRMLVGNAAADSPTSEPKVCHRCSKHHSSPSTGPRLSCFEIFQNATF
jgi:hypothetical protein